MKVVTSMVVPVLTLHTESNDSWQWIGAGIFVSGIPGSVIGSQGLTSEDAVLKSSTSKVGIVLERHDGG